jgi:hypothetical protein
MKDQNSVSDGESQLDKWNRALDLFIESVHKPDTSLRSCAHNQKCYNELLQVRDQVLANLQHMRRHENRF